MEIFLSLEHAQRCVDGGAATNPHSLTLDEAASITLYTLESPLYQLENARLRGADRNKLKAMFPLLKLQFGGISKLPAVHATVFRGVKLDLHADYPVKKKFFWWQFTSCTSRLEVMSDPMFLGTTGARTIFSIEAWNLVSIRDFSTLKHEEELLLLPGTYLEVVSTLDAGNGLWMIQLQQIKSPAMCDALPSVGPPSQATKTASAPAAATAAAAA